MNTRLREKEKFRAKIDLTIISHLLLDPKKKRNMLKLRMPPGVALQYTLSVVSRH